MHDIPTYDDFQSQYRRITNSKPAGSSQNRRRHFKNFDETKLMLGHQSQDIGLRAISKIFNRWCRWKIQVLFQMTQNKCRVISPKIISHEFIWFIFNEHGKVMDFVFSDFQNQRLAMVQRLLLQLLLLCCAVGVFGSSLLNRHREHLKWFLRIVK